VGKRPLSSSLAARPIGNRDCFVSEGAPKGCAEDFVLGAFQTNIMHPDA
jgi:hypothetical protein